MDFQFKIPQNVIVGTGSLKKLPDLLKGLNSKRVLLISDYGIEQSGLVEKVKNIISANGLECFQYLDIRPNPVIKMCDEALTVYKECGATSIIALGGGSPMDVAKAVGVLANYGGKITDYEGADKVPGDIVPLIAIPTTAGTGSESTAFSVIVDEERNYKFTVYSYNLLPKYALIDPELLYSMPASVASACGIDALIHAMESYISRYASPFTDALAEKAMSLIGGNIRQFVACRNNEEAAFAMAVGSNLAGIAFAWARLGNIHAMSHPISAYFNVPHGVANAILMPTIAQYNALADCGKYERIFNFIKWPTGIYDEFNPQMLVNELTQLNSSLGIPQRLSDVHVTEDKIHVMAMDAMKSGNIAANPRSSNLKDIEMLYKTAL